MIKQLHEADPSGELHVRVNGGVPWCCERKPGYWDGPYAYIKNNKWVETTKGEKVDLYTMELEDFIWDNNGEIDGKIIVDYTYLDQVHKCDFQSKCDKIAKEAREYNAKS